MTEATTSISSYVGVNLTVPQKTSYTIKFNANGGSGTAPTDLTKWDSETAYLPNNTFTRKGYDFVGWGTSESGGTIYLEGAAYTGNAAATLYAIWKSNYIAPTLSNLTATRVALVDEEYVETDDGNLAHVKFNYSVPYEDYEELSHTIKIGIKATDEDEYTYVSVEGEYELVDAVITGIVLDTEKAYDIIAMIEADGEIDAAAEAVLEDADFMPMHELEMTVEDLDSVCVYMTDLVSEYEGDADVQPFEEEGRRCANLYIAPPTENADEFLSAASHYDASGSTLTLGEAAGERVSMLLVLKEG